MHQNSTQSSHCIHNGNATLCGLPQSTLAPLQRILNAVARLACDLHPPEHVTSALIDLHWLPAVTARIELKICMIVYQSLNSTAPAYISDMLQPVSSLQRQTRYQYASPPWGNAIPAGHLSDSDEILCCCGIPINPLC